MPSDIQIAAPELRVQLSEEERLARLLEARASRPKGERMWVFGFGSLMWNPCFDYDVQTAAVLPGYERKFHTWTTRARGTPERPGLGLCLEDYGSECRGVAFRVLEDAVEDAWDRLWAREMGSGIYRAAWLGVHTDTHGWVPALTFVVNRNHPHYAGDMALEKKAEVMSGACGEYGLCRDYLFGTIQEMRKLGVVDPELDALLEAVDERRTEIAS